MTVVQFPRRGAFNRIDLPGDLVASIIDVARGRQHLHPMRSPKLREFVEERGIGLHPLQKAFLTWPASRIYYVDGGLTGGVYFLSEDQATACLITEERSKPRPLPEGSTPDFVISYAAEDLDYARAVRHFLEQFGAKAFMVDINENAGDAYWWITYKLAIHQGAYFVPILSSTYARRHGSHAEAVEILFTVDSVKDHRNWFPILPIVRSLDVGEDSDLTRLLMGIPGWLAPEIDQLEHFVLSANAIRTRIGRVFVGDWSIRLDDTERYQRLETVPTIDGNEALLVQFDDETYRFPKLSEALHAKLTPPNPGQRPDHLDQDAYSRLMIEGQNHLDAGDPHAAMGFFAQCEAGDRDPEYNRMSLCLEAMGRKVEALAFLLRTRQKILDRGYYEKVAELHGPPDIDDAEYFKTSFSASFRAQVAKRLKALKPYIEQAAHVDVRSVIDGWRGRETRSDRNPGFPTGWEAIVPDTIDFEPTGVRSYMLAAHGHAEAGRFHEAERTLAHAVANYGAIESSAPLLHLMSILAAEQNERERALDHMVFALDVDPERKDTRGLMKRFLEGEDIRLSIQT